MSYPSKFILKESKPQNYAKFSSSEQDLSIHSLTCPSIKQLRESWESNITDELVSICKEDDVPLLTLETSGNFKSQATNSSKSHDANSEQSEEVAFLYDSKDFYEQLLPIFRNTTWNRSWKDCFVSESYSWLHVKHRHVGIDDVTARNRQVDTLQARLLFARQLHETSQGLEFGSFHSDRLKVWKEALGITTDKEFQKSYFDKLKNFCSICHLCTDRFFMNDVASLQDDPTFFIFADVMEEILLCFSRDDVVLKETHYIVHQHLDHSVFVNDRNMNVSIPLCGVLPFSSIAIYMAPLSFVTDDIAEHYFLARQMYCHIWSHLNVISNDANTIVDICFGLEALLQEHGSHLLLFLMKKNINVLDICFPWIHRAFVSYLSIHQLLLLWDRIVATKDLNILALLSFGWLMFKSEAIFLCEERDDIIQVLNDFSHINVMTILQMVFLEFILEESIE